MSDPRKNKLRGRLSVVIPAFAQEKTIGADLVRVQETIDEISDDYEILVVVDGEVDKTPERARAVAGPRTRIEVIRENRGKGYAVRYGVAQSDGSIVGFIDAGEDIDPAGIETAARLVDSGAADLAVGSKRHPRSQVKYPLGRQVYSRGYQLLCRILFNLNVRDTQVGIKFMTREVADRVIPYLRTDGFAFDVELLALAQRRGFRRIEECPITIDLRFPSSIRAGTVFDMLWDTLRVFYRMRVIEVYDNPPESL